MYILCGLRCKGDEQRELRIWSTFIDTEWVHTIAYLAGHSPYRIITLITNSNQLPTQKGKA